MRSLDRRQAARALISGFVTLTAELGPLKGATYAAMLRDTSPEGGLCVLLDGDCRLTRGTKVAISFTEAPSVSAWVAHNTYDGQMWRIGVCFAPVAEEEPEAELCEQPTPDQRRSRLFGFLSRIGQELFRREPERP